MRFQTFGSANCSQSTGQSTMNLAACFDRLPSRVLWVNGRLVLPDVLAHGLRERLRDVVCQRPVLDGGDDGIARGVDRGVEALVDAAGAGLRDERDASLLALADLRV